MGWVCSGRRADATAGPEGESRARRAAAAAAAVPRLAERGAAGSIVCWLFPIVRYCIGERGDWKGKAKVPISYNGFFRVVKKPWDAINCFQRSTLLVAKLVRGLRCVSTGSGYLVPARYGMLPRCPVQGGMLCGPGQKGAFAPSMGRRNLLPVTRSRNAAKDKNGKVRRTKEQTRRTGRNSTV